MLDGGLHMTELADETTVAPEAVSEQPNTR
jgi:hypothetical protein